MIIRICARGVLLQGAARTDEGPYGHREATGNAGDNPANRAKDRTKEKAGKEGGRAGRPARWKAPAGRLSSDARPAKAHNEKGLQLSLQAFGFPGAEGQN